MLEAFFMAAVVSLVFSVQAGEGRVVRKRWWWLRSWGPNEHEVVLYGPDIFGSARLDPPFAAHLTVHLVLNCPCITTPRDREEVGAKCRMLHRES